jgi:DNA-binding MarR family transcriptional regulator
MSGDALILDRFLPYRLSVTSALVSAAVARAYEALFALTIPEWRVIAITAEREPVTQAEIGEVARMDKVTISRAAIALTRRGLIERRVHPGDRRAQLLALSPAGRELYAAVVPKALAIERAMLADLSPDELLTLAALLRRIDTAVLALPADFGQDQASAPGSGTGK